MKGFLAYILMLVFLHSYAQQELLYISTASGNFDIHKLNTATGESVRLTDNKGWDWSPKYVESTGLVFYYSTDTTKNFNYKIMNLDGLGIEMAFPEGDNMLPSPDGRYFSYTVKSGEVQQIYVFDRSSGKSVIAVGNSCYNGRVCWKKDGSGFAFISDRDGNNEVYYYDLDSTEQQRLTRDEKRQKYLAWSPDGEYLAYSEELSDTSNQIKILELSTGSIRGLTGPEYVDSELSWSPDGNRIAFHSVRDQGDQLYMIDIHTGEVSQLTSADAYHGEPEWIND